ncbi:uncharacterized protein N7515_009589 [Penicillium bovifimosum]|uniref:Uncharacterized protein n=1 Tax=Penicillium bovifimosum TaxID=126998 RepID=A0A9W9KVZ5_9EURO|nr:uncharacterized protein N7515_009589 [Penicillium bovifimosum]KAJ5121628.1 hypothetical protein N7515_009589 [Penicillium bovifimosum]
MAADNTWARVAEVACRSVADLQLAEQPFVTCRVGRENWNRPLASVAINEWINDNYIIWTLGAALAKSGLDTQWTRTFEQQHLAQWIQIHERVAQLEGPARCLLDIPTPPAKQAVFTARHRRQWRIFTIAQTSQHVRPRPGFQLLTLLDFVHRGGLADNTSFAVVLHIPGRRGLSASELYQLLSMTRIPGPASVSPLAHSRQARDEFPTPPPLYHRLSPGPPLYTEREDMPPPYQLRLRSISPAGRPYHSSVGPRDESPGRSLSRDRSPSPSRRGRGRGSDRDHARGRGRSPPRGRSPGARDT